MTEKQRATKKYLLQTRHLALRVRSRIERIQELNALATKITVVYSDMPKPPTRKTDRMESAVVAIVDLDLTIAQELCELVKLQADVERAISRVSDADCRTLLELRYIDFKSWDQIMNEMHFSRPWLQSLHLRALDALDLKEQTKVD